MDQKKLSVEQAYRAMFYFLEKEYERTGADEIGGLLSSLAWTITEGRGPADLGAWQDWRDAVERVLMTEGNASPPHY
ncbi:hypothetical protein [Cupriavidus gilardii]|uniref:hypothetical protein n=1 Tax=Cupriavidus gilardii TaxID=82541 RepID=UPI0009ECFBAF|nr:hypothetical protein [Cupriavidus gilardii]